MLTAGPLFQLGTVMRIEAGVPLVSLYTADEIGRLGAHHD